MNLEFSPQQQRETFSLDVSVKSRGFFVLNRDCIRSHDHGGHVT